MIELVFWPLMVAAAYGLKIRDMIRVRKPAATVSAPMVAAVPVSHVHPEWSGRKLQEFYNRADAEYLARTVPTAFQVRYGYELARQRAAHNAEYAAALERWRREFSRIGSIDLDDKERS